MVSHLDVQKLFLPHCQLWCCLLLHLSSHQWWVPACHEIGTWLLAPGNRWLLCLQGKDALSTLWCPDGTPFGRGLQLSEFRSEGCKHHTEDFRLLVQSHHQAVQSGGRSCGRSGMRMRLECRWLVAELCHQSLSWGLWMKPLLTDLQREQMAQGLQLLAGVLKPLFESSPGSPSHRQGGLGDTSVDCLVDGFGRRWWWAGPQEQSGEKSSTFNPHFPHIMNASHLWHKWNLSQLLKLRWQNYK